MGRCAGTRAASSLLYYRDIDRVDRRQKIADHPPVLPAIGRGKELSGVRPDVDAAGILRIGAHAVTQHAEPDILALRQSVPGFLPLVSRFLSPIDGEVSVDVCAGHPVFYDREKCLRVMRVECDGKAEFRG